MRSNLCILAAIALLTACTTPITDRAANIQVHKFTSTLLNSCKVIGPVNVETTPSSWQANQSEAINAARDKAAEMGADTLVIVNSEIMVNGFMFAKKVSAVIQGTALRCYETSQ